MRGLISGEVAGLVFALVTIWFTTELGDAADQPLLMISTIATGEGSVVAGSSVDVLLGLLVHLMVAGLFGIGFGALAPRLGTNGTVLATGAAYGLVVYAFNFRVLSPFVFPAFQEASQPFEVLVHQLYGLLLAAGFLSWGVRRREPLFVWNPPT